MVLTPLSKDLMEIESKKVESLRLGSYGAKERLRNEKKRKIETEIAHTVSIADDEAKKANHRSALAAVKKRVQLRQKE